MNRLLVLGLVGCARDVTGEWVGDCTQSVDTPGIRESVGVDLVLIDDDGAVTGDLTLHANIDVVGRVEGTHDGDAVDLVADVDEGTFELALTVDAKTLVGPLQYVDPDGQPYGSAYDCVLE